MADQDAVRTPLGQRLRDWSGTPLTVAVWIAAAVAASVMLIGRVRHVAYPGIARGGVFEISSATTGTVRDLRVRLFESVDSGDIVADLDPARVEAEIATARAELARIEAQLDAARLAIEGGASPTEIDRRTELRRFAVDVEDRRLEELSLLVSIESDRVIAQRLGLERRRIEALERDGVVSEAELDDIRLRHETVLRRIDENRRLLAQVRRERDAAQARLEQFSQTASADELRDASLAPLRAEIDTQNARIAELQVARQALVLRSPVDGQIASILARPGQAVVAGQPVVRVAQRFASDIIAYAPDRAPRMPRVGQPAKVIARRGGPALESVVLRVGPAIEPMPNRLWRNAGITEYGRPFLVAAGAPLRLIPGELVDVQVEAGAD
ncbi:MAG: HlyD family efflux transporter periplasmic adaptor subunit [Deltaproteobacteria bacterium]|nr:MAG: HlyD family efflux transporter periplasmic adaptor subunit [Deltaproteobacteria bacterium]